MPNTAFDTTNEENPPKGLIDDLTSLVDQGVTVVIYHSDTNWICNWYGGEAVANEVNAPRFPNAGYVNISTSNMFH